MTDSEKDLDNILRRMGAATCAIGCLDSDAAQSAAREEATRVTWRKIAPFFGEQIALSVYCADEAITVRLQGALCDWLMHQREVHRHLGESGALWIVDAAPFRLSEWRDSDHG